MPKILIIEDEQKIRQIVQAYLVKEGFEVMTAADGSVGFAMCQEYRPDLIILDLMLPGMTGEQILTNLRQISDTPVIILSAKSTEDQKIFGLDIGADDYLTKPFSPRELVARVNAHLRRIKAEEKAESANRLSFNGGQLQIDLARYEVLQAGQPVSLTRTEFKVLVFLAQNPGRVFTRSQLVEQVQGYNYDGYDRTIDSHIKNLRQKIEINPEEPVLILTVFGVGYKFGGERDA